MLDNTLTGRLRLPDDDLERVLGWMDNGADMSREDLPDVCTPAVAHAETRQQSCSPSARRPRSAAALSERISKLFRGAT